MTDTLPNAEIQAEACAWLAQLDAATLSAKDLEAFQEWLKRSPAHQREMQRLASLWGDMNVLTELMGPIEVAHAREQKLLKRGRPWLVPTFATALASACLVLFAGLFFIGSDRFNSSNVAASILVTDMGEKLSSTLPDGSTVILNTNSKIEVDFGPSVRKIRLLSGEAIFDIVPDGDRPLLVYAGDGLVRVVGTVFSVKLDDAAVNVAVSEGAVEVAPLQALNGSDIAPEITAGYVRAGHRAVFENQRTRIEPIPLAEIESDLSWQNGVLTFSGEPLEQVVQEVSRYTKLNIIIADPELNQLRVGGVYPSTETDTLFETLEAGFGVHVERRGDHSVVLTRVAEE